jgi:hypothetical protein
MSSKLFGSSGRHANPIGIVSIVTGIGGALASAVLWIYQIEPGSRIMGKYSAELAAGGLLSEQLASLAAVLGLMAIITSMMASSGWEGGGGYFIGLVLGIVALSYPVLTWLNLVSGPLQPGFLR